MTGDRNAAINRFVTAAVAAAREGRHPSLAMMRRLRAELAVARDPYVDPDEDQDRDRDRDRDRLAAHEHPLHHDHPLHLSGTTGPGRNRNDHEHRPYVAAYRDYVTATDAAARLIDPELTPEANLRRQATTITSARGCLRELRQQLLSRALTPNGDP
ncbi:hypothetical protein CMMCAS06_16330 [Clavibacter michiganensis subsp. michiganensis]|uniref:hypothetical protein n=1 Tax=Clavibacter michiganensis TaxID=28447 RepID=UPI000B6B604C|nr:hypothetical protein [Clavibacter michiganensis]OUD99757.1 hypothetical protein CMMCAS06_16330 [Clavibacter michiganensis subsp. michiganensis]